MHGREYLEDDDIIRGHPKRREPKPKPKKANHKHDWVETKEANGDSWVIARMVCTKCNKVGKKVLYNTRG